MQNKEIGFVLKRFFPQKQKLSILCQYKGKISITTNPEQRFDQLRPGMLISFNYSGNTSSIYFANNIEILMTPQDIKYDCFTWLHRFLEICYYFVPIEKPCHEIFFHLYNYFLIYKLEYQFLTQIEIIKKIYLLKLLALLGFYPNKELLAFLNIYDQLSSLYVDFKDQQKVEFLKWNLQKIKKVHNKKIDDWILNCINSHPSFKKFKMLKEIQKK
ncbi:hypothetical protein KAT08_00440 [Candidatus Babeliales bacterium]|nr:hypothetical protein [Candidatus Babeliales bacterium]